jgi:PTS system nitrogen regulatory IIA component
MRDFIAPDAVIAGLKASSKKQALMDLSRKAAELTGLHERTIFDVVMERERLGSTGIGRGIAIPHGKLPNLQKVHIVFARADRPIDFDSVDGQPVDLIVLLLAPDNAGADHLKALARISRMLRDEALCEKLRGCHSPDGILALLGQAEAHAA